jgi:hypothetical protein
LAELLKTYEKDLQIPLQYLAAATLIHRMKIPADIREKIKETAVTGSIVGLPAITGLYEQIRVLTRGTEPEL